MVDTHSDILARLAAGEDERTEFKEVRFSDRSVVSPTTESIAGEIVAFANNGGGTLLFGIADDGAVRGIPEPLVAAVEQWATNISLHNCDPPLSCRVRPMEVAGPAGPTTIVLCEVPVGLSVHRSSGGRYYVRAGAAKRDLTAAELAQLFQERGRYLAADEQPVRSASLADLDADAVRTHLLGRNGVPWPDLLRLTRVLTADEAGESHPTLAALVAFGREVQDHLPHATIEAAAFRAGDKSSGRITHAERMSGPGGAQVRGAVDFVREAMQRLGVRYPLAAVQEAIENAVRHRDYGRVDAKIRLCLFADRLELLSPGHPPNTVTPASLPYRRFTRNQLLARFLGQPSSGRSLGVAGLLHDCERESRRRPDYRMAGDDLLLTIWAAPSPGG